MVRDYVTKKSTLQLCSKVREDKKPANSVLPLDALPEGVSWEVYLRISSKTKWTAT